SISSLRLKLIERITGTTSFCRSEGAQRLLKSAALHNNILCTLTVRYHSMVAVCVVEGVPVVITDNLPLIRKHFLNIGTCFKILNYGYLMAKDARHLSSAVQANGQIR
ncbi:MAG: hypothetical protein JW795_09795, partial [Chitinivibrionales bacterium]|nr:hypothetical protein [Chitinivibrionales bacterium]